MNVNLQNRAVKAAGAAGIGIASANLVTLFATPLLLKVYTPEQVAQIGTNLGVVAMFFAPLLFSLIPALKPKSEPDEG